jgi:hypothetical protein
MNLTLIGNAVFISMDIPDTFLAVSNLPNHHNIIRIIDIPFIVLKTPKLYPMGKSQGLFICHVHFRLDVSTPYLEFTISSSEF